MGKVQPTKVLTHLSDISFHLVSIFLGLVSIGIFSLLLK